ncbi:hypothetical protein QC764_116430 [Podospora pseudoanserina]|uniref:Uncharacterized protein n=1 Tax=Podospora pseudoanserina TaxID=2609844 RepID=A0ABR0IQN0_9PEZI|nr:hypothetical protein QC764_116430 [Podospora pseudoanserina]
MAATQTPTVTQPRQPAKPRPSPPSVSLSTPPPDLKEVNPVLSPTAVEANINHPPHANGGAHMSFEFEGLAIELNTQLEYVRVEDGENTDSKRPTTWLLKSKDPNKAYLPGQPRIRLGERARHVDGPEGKVDGYLRRWHLTDKLDQLLPLMRYIFVQTPAYDHINALHHHAAHTRRIVVDEEPGLHLVWYYETIFMKPIPPYFFSRAFWMYIAHADPEVYRASLGFMRSYYHIIRFEIDFHEACKKKLMPRKDNGKFPTYEEWCEFIEPFSLVGDKHVSRRFKYGELRLTRINRAAMFFRFNLAYFHLLPQWGSFLSHILAPLITAFAVCSVILNSMQVTLAAIEVANETNYDIPGPEEWKRFMNVSLYFPIIVILSIVLVIGVTLISVFLMGLKDLLRGNKVREKKRLGQARVGKGSHGMVW